MAGTLVTDRLEASSAAQLVIENGVANTPPTIVDLNGTEVGTLCRAWVSFNGSGTVAIRSSFNVSSITDHATGEYTVNMTNAMPDANYSVSAQAQSPGTAAITICMFGYYTAGPTLTKIDPTTSTFRFICSITAAPYAADPLFVTASVFR